MAIVPIMDLKPGVKLVKSVYTPLGSLLFHKEKVLLPRDLEILEAFLVENVEVGQVGEKIIQSKEKNSSTDSVVQQDQPPFNRTSLFVEEYDKLFNLIKSAYPSIAAVGIPIYEIRNQLESLIQYIKDYSLISFLPRLINDHDYMYHNAVLCALSSYKLAEWSGLPKKDWMQVAFAGLFHDIGNVKVDPSILFKPDRLTLDEINEMREHTKMGHQLLKNVAGINEGVRLAALQHHEKVDGTGYPLGIDSNKIHIYSKIVGVVDIFHAMTLNKAYRKGQSPYLVLEQILSESFGKLDPKLVQTFIKKVTEFNNGVIVRLSNDKIGEIVFSNHNEPTRPMVSVGNDIINLEQQRHLYIIEIIKKNN
ncbi:HD-GYP domain-containing protein [Paenibacillus macquariensis]|uniref:HD-GYP domain, c-di-GMP phosphodiesterase class II (Or its inactivated variant) n=1 Tax=Paenibacillus macquariensis TaxID=948756 RepID=A0ABY1KA84_9BACL|nr:HD-GYP domain-containing protein [Paenibacillus macquariensis]MEC0093785.1 HD-GYP domain-containing protein [Paenibacillus macquariensis]OAB31728.1 HD family phosphohydrolase [Paenibacillus macquariensis subsp. macquariensis]SIR49557.1 HD-GYP domain, c-di-GMP phosphodiesterase class II (or its inactivated variant) [Paenibacillus macquariensis]